MLGFRVWDSERKEMISGIYTDHFMMNMKGIVYEGCPGDEENASEELTMIDDNFIPMQSTGIKDWKAKPIFEGDMLFIHYHEKGLTNDYYLVNTVREFLLFYGARMLSIYKIANDGNVYEQPTLLEKLK